jgi:probable F420-dependent oxidoreductase
VLLSAVGDAMTRVAGEVADGLIVHSFTTRRYIREVTLPTLGQGLARGGRAREDFEFVYAPFVVTGTDEAAMAASAAVARERIAFYASTPAYRPVLELHGWGDLQGELNVLARRGEWQAMGGLIDDTMLGEFAVVAPPDELPAAHARWVGGLVDRTSFTPPETMDSDATRELIASIKAHAAEVAASTAGREILT